MKNSNICEAIKDENEKSCYDFIILACVLSRISGSGFSCCGLGKKMPGTQNNARVKPID